jgi:hypothetical protein
MRWFMASAGLGWALMMVFVSARPAAAIPAWTRKYDVECSNCHVAGFRLTRMGQDFLRSGHRLEGGAEKQTLSEHVSFAYKDRFAWSKTKQENDAITEQKNTFEQHAFSIYVGGPLETHWSYFAELYFHENSGRTSGASDLDDFARSKLADAYLQYLWRENDEALTSVRFGQFSPYLLHLHGVGARLSQDRPYVINSGTVGTNPYKPFTRQYGLEVSQYFNRVNVAAAIVNGTGGKLFNRVDNDLKKDVYATADVTFDDNGSMLGVYGCAGNYPIFLDDATKEANSYDQFNQIAGIGNYTLKQGALLGAVFSGRNEVDPRDVTAPNDTLDVETKSLGYYAELQVYALHPRVQPYMRWDFWDPDTVVDDNEVQGPLVGVSWRALDNGRLVLHFQQLKTRNAVEALEKTQNSVVFEANFMF